MTEVAAKGKGSTDSADDQSSSHLVLVFPKLRRADERRHYAVFRPYMLFPIPCQLRVMERTRSRGSALRAEQSKWRGRADQLIDRL
jgi:hypothetical protein